MMLWPPSAAGMSSFTDPAKLAELKAFVDFCQEDPSVTLRFFRNLLIAIYRAPSALIETFKYTALAQTAV